MGEANAQPAGEELGELWSIARAATACDCSEDKVLAWGHAGLIRLINIGDGRRAVFRTPKRDVINLLHGRVVQQVRTVRRERRRSYSPRYTQQRHNRGACAQRS
jgi:hypothetical protein